MIEGLELIPFNYDNETSSDDLVSLANLIEESNPDRIVFLDHKPHPIRILHHLHKTLGGKLPAMVVHLFGDFTLYYRDWVASEQFLKDQQITFVVPSERQGDLVNKYLLNDKAHICPFPVEKREFEFDEKLRKEERIKWKVEDKDTVFVYTGRLSRQKRIHTLISAFEAVALQNSDAHLYLFGQTDHLGDQFMNIWEKEGEYLIKLVRLHENLPEHVRSRIHFMGNVKWQKLKAVYSGADYFISLSVHNDEDYGMSIAEAQASGLPCLLSDWGGFGGFELKEYADAVKYIPVKLGKFNKLVSKQKTIELMKEALQMKPDRKKIYQLAMNDKSIEAVKLKTEKILSNQAPKFDTFSPFLHFVSSRIEFGLGLYLNNKLQISKYYKKIYDSYLRHH
jgi:glycosyltransferase involved in cell wall biosynthesis